jgi:phage protein U
VNLRQVISDVRTALAIDAGGGAERRQMLAQLGDIQFNVVGPLTGLETKRASTYAQHAIIGSKPLLQSTGDELDVITLSLGFKDAFCDPIAAYSALCAASAAHTVLPLIFADGAIAGRFVITEIGDTVDHTTGLGSVTSRTTQVTLTEWHEVKALEVKSRAAAKAKAAGNLAKAPKRTRTGSVLRGADPHTVPVGSILRQRGSFTAGAGTDW